MDKVRYPLPSMHFNRIIHAHTHMYTYIYEYVCICISEYAYAYKGFLGGSVVKESACNAEATGNAG